MKMNANLLRNVPPQRLLVDMGDKEPSFIGSNNWIGAIELGYVMDAYLGVTCKVVTVGRGADVPSVARQLARHFETQVCAFTAL